MSASCQPDTTHLLFSPCTADYIISLFHTPRTRESLGDGGEVWVQREKERIADEKRGKRVEEALNQETERSWHKDKKHSTGAPRVWGLCVGIMSAAKHIQPH